MNECLNSMIDITTNCPDPTSFDLDAFPFWTEISVMEVVAIPEVKPDMEQIDSIVMTPEIKRKKVIVTPTSTGDNEEGKIVTGRKIVIDGLLCATLTYVADVEDQALHSAHITIPFSAFIVLEEPTIDFDPLDYCYDVRVCIEDVFVKKINCRQVFINTTMLLQAVTSKLKVCLDSCY